MKVNLFTLLAAQLTFGCLGGVFAQTATWTGATNSNWTTSTNWDTGNVPNTLGESAIVGLPAPTVYGGNSDIDSLTVTADGQLQISSGSLNLFGPGPVTLSNFGVIDISSGGTVINVQFVESAVNSGQISVQGSTFTNNLRGFGNTTISGGGTITLTQNAGLGGLSATFLTIADQTIDGWGTVGSGAAMEFSPDAMVDANSTGNRLRIIGDNNDAPSGFGIVNNGIVRASAGGTLQFFNSMVDNTNGIIEALDGSFVETNNTFSNGTTIFGGLIRSIDSGQVILDGTVTLVDLTIDSSLTPITTVRLMGQIDNLQTITVDDGARIRVELPATTLTGGGTISLTGNGSNWIEGNGILTIDDQVVEGAGRLGNAQAALVFTPSSVIDANVNGIELLVDGDANDSMTGFDTVNNSVMRASEGGILLLQNDFVDNSNGTIEALDGSTVDFRGFSANSPLSIEGGLVQSLGTGQVTIAAESSATSFVRLRDLTLDANMLVGRGFVELEDQINNTGSITVAPLSGNATLDIRGDSKNGGATLTGGGTLTFNSSFADARISGGSDGILTVSDQIIQGHGRLNSIAAEFGDDALLDANDPGETFTLQPDNDPGINGFGVVNRGLLRASSGGILRVLNAAVENNSGQIEAMDASTVELNSNSQIVGGMIATSETGQILAEGQVVFENLTLDADLHVNTGGSELRLEGTINNLNTITVQTNADVLALTDEITTLQGGGNVLLVGNAQISGVIGSDKTLQVDDQTIQGAGIVGRSAGFGTAGIALEFGENAIVDSNVAGDELLVDGDASIAATGFGTINRGIMRASSGGTLLLESDLYDNNNGVIEALADSIVQLERTGGTNEVSITGGTIRSEGTGQVVLGFSGVVLQDLSLEADFRNNGQPGTIAGNINNTGTITIDFNGIQVDSAGATLTGGGEVILAGTSASLRSVSSNDATLIVGDQMIRGFGNLGNSSLAMKLGTNTIVDANVAGQRIDVDGRVESGRNGFGTENRGVMRASNGGTLRLENDAFDNSAGTIEALADSIVELQPNVSILGGAIRSEGTGQVETMGGDIALHDLTIDGNIRIPNSSDLALSGVIQNTGTILAEYTGGFNVFADIEIPLGGTTISGSGTTILSGANARIFGDAAVTFENGTLMGDGQVNVDSIFNGATIAAGLSVGELRLSNATLASGTTIRHEVQSIVDDPGVTADVIDVSGQLDLSNTTIELVSLDATRTPGDVSDFNPNQSSVFTIAIADSMGYLSQVSVDNTAFPQTSEGSFCIATQPVGNRTALIVRYLPTVLGDTNLDGFVSLLDIAPFVEALSKGVYLPEADTNCDGIVNLLDVAPFVNILVG